MFISPENNKKTCLLSDLAIKYHSDKVPQLYHNYTPFYHELFKNRRNSVKKVFEIGIGYGEIMPITDYISGAGLYMWRDYFPNAQIYGIDIKAELMIRKDRIQTFVCNQSHSWQLINLAEKLGGNFDLIIDDGSHIADHQSISAITLTPYLSDNGIYIIEDLKEPEKVENNLKMMGIECSIHRFDVNLKSDDILLLIRKNP